MEDVYANYETSKESSSSTPSAGFHQDASANESARCPNCGRDLSQPNLLPPSILRSAAKPQGISQGHGICGQCGGLGSGLLAGI
jgi:hypothetical protein